MESPRATATIRRASPGLTHARAGCASLDAIAYTSDAVRRRVREPGLRHAADGNLTSSGTDTYVWNARNQLAQIKQSTAVIASLRHDPLGRRVDTNLNGATTGYFGCVLGNAATSGTEFAAGVCTVDDEATRIGRFPSFIYGRTFGALFQYGSSEVNSAETGLPQINSGLDWHVPHHNGK